MFHCKPLRMGIPVAATVDAEDLQGTSCLHVLRVGTCSHAGRLILAKDALCWHHACNIC